MTDYETTWWEICGETPWEDLPSGGRKKSSIFRCIGGAEERLAKDLPVGALFALDRSHCKSPNGWPRAGADGMAIACVCLGGRHWHIEGRASNCTRPEEQDHRCWVRQGTVGDRLTVDKNGPTCGAGAGSFFMGQNDEWHGFLRGGKLVQA